jgi:zinc and cadmium transporter
MSPFFSAISAGIVVSLIPFVGLWGFSLSEKRLAGFLRFIVAFAAGSLLGTAFFHILPEAVETGGPVFESCFAGLFVFFVIDSLLWIYHCHGGHHMHEGEEVGSKGHLKPVGVLNLVGDAVHNFIDGVVIGTTFLVSPALGWTTVLAVALHEVPQEIGDLGVLLHAGFTIRRAMYWNIIVAFTALLGVVSVFVAQSFVVGIADLLLPFAAGGFIYMACTNLLAEIKEESSIKHRIGQTVFLLLGVAIIWGTSFLE